MEAARLWVIFVGIVLPGWLVIALAEKPEASDASNSTLNEQMTDPTQNSKSNYSKVSCDFSQNACGWENVGGDNYPLRWERKRSSYMHLSMGDAGEYKKGRLASLWLPQLTKYRCQLRFQYFIRNIESCQLSLIRQSFTGDEQEVWVPQESTGWYYFSGPVYQDINCTAGKYRLVFEGWKSCDVNIHNEIDIQAINFIVHPEHMKPTTDQSPPELINFTIEPYTGTLETTTPVGSTTPAATTSSTVSPSQLMTQALSTATPTVSPSQLTTQALSTATPSAATTRPLPESDKTRILRNLTKSEVGRKTVALVKKVVQEPGQTSAADVVQVATFLDRASQLSNISTQVATGLLEIVDTVAELNQSVLQKSNSVGNTTNRLIAAVEQLADKVSLEEGQVRLQTNSTVLQVWNLTSSSTSTSLFLGLQLRSDGDSHNATSVTNLSDSDTYTNVDSAIFLPRDMGRSIAEQNPGRDVRLSASVIQQTSLFQVDSNTDSQHTNSQDTDTSQAPTTGEGASGAVILDSKVISMRITVGGQPISNLSAFGHGNVTIVFTPLQPVTEKAAAAAAADQVEQRAGRKCVFWDFALRQGRGGWSGRGCHLEGIKEGKVVCVCDHLTNFAILMDLRGQGEEVDIIHERILGLISMVGLILSICGLSLTLLAFFLVRKLRKSLPQQTLFNMALSMFLSWVTFLVGIERVESHVVCVAVAMLLHYFILVSFLWMLAQGILQFFMLVKVRSRPFTRYMLKAGLFAWGLPVLPVIVVSAVDVELYRGGKRYCWMSRTPFYYAFMAPVALIVAINMIIYVVVVVSICRRPKLGTGGTSYTTISIRASISCFVMLGLSWIFAFFALGEARLVFQYLFTCTTALQGLLIFALYTARDPVVRAFLNRVRKRRSYRTAEAERPSNVRPQMRTRSTKETSFIGSD